MFKEIPMLKYMTLTRTVRLLWSGYDVQNSMGEYFLEGTQIPEKWSSIEESLKLKIRNCLFLPNELQIVLSSLVKPIGGCIKNIVERIYGNDYIPSNFMGILHWTLLGIIDEKKTAKAVIRDENLLITKRYKIACTYCLKDEILMLWRELPDIYKHYFLNTRGLIRTQFYLHVYWTYYMRAELHKLDRKILTEYGAPLSCHYFGILRARVNQVAIEYFIGKLSVQEKEHYFRVFFPSLEFTLVMSNYSPSNSYFSDIIYFLLSQMNENQRTDIFKMYAYHILKNFMEFPYGGMFLEIESVMQKYLTYDQRKALERRYQETIGYFVFRTFGSNSR
ncbi:ANK_REP_REGION domain-containing protein [Trichonephila clavipes]|nr:ANK_REP_REGION domain-containing protein [Trichonephila clavipes]